MYSINVTPGCGGQESHDFGNMLSKMYSNFLTAHGVKFTLSVENNGHTTNIIKTEDERVLDWFKGETGIHRLVRISPHDAEKRRHTSFAYVEVTSGVGHTPESYDKPIRSYTLDPYKSVSAFGVQLTDKVDEVLNGQLEWLGINLPKFRKPTEEDIAWAKNELLKQKVGPFRSHTGRGIV